MKYKHYLFAGIAGAILPSAFATAQPADKPNIILIYIDDMGYSDPGCFGGDFTPTPNINRLAEEGTRLTQFYSAAPISSPSRVAITTGMYPLRWGISTFLNHRKANRRNEQNDFLTPKAPSLARALKAGGYATGHFGKWHMGGGRDVDDAPSIKEYGFDEYASTWESPDPDPLLTAEDWIWSNSDSIKRWERTGYFVDKTLDFLKRHAGTPCYVNLWPDDMHAPWVPNSRIAGQEKKTWMFQDSFTQVLARLDKEIGRLLDGLDALGITHNTIVILTSDNGPEPSFRNKRTDGMKEQKGCLYEGGIRMPFIIRWPAKIKGGTTDDKTVASTVDLFPTLCAMTETKIRTGYPLDGCDLSRAFFGSEKVKRQEPLFWEYGKTFIIPDPLRWGNVYSPHLAMRNGDWKILVNADGSGAELYNLANDRNETTNVISEHPEIATTMIRQVQQWFHEANRQYVGPLKNL